MTVGQFGRLIVSHTNGWMTIWMTIAWYQCILSEFLVGLNRGWFLSVNWCIVGLNDSSLMACVLMARTLRGRLWQCGLTVDGHPPMLELEEHGLADSLSRWAMGAQWSACMDGPVGSLMVKTQGCLYMLWEGLRPCCHAFVHPSMEFSVPRCSEENRVQMKMQIHYDILVVAWNRRDWHGGHSSACCGKADQSTIHCRSVTSWNVRCSGCDMAWSDSDSDDGGDCEHGLGQVIGPGQPMQVDAGRLMSRNEGAIWKMRKPFRLRMRFPSGGR